MGASLITLGRVSSAASGADISADAIANYISSDVKLIKHLIGLCFGINSVTIWKTPALLAQRWLISAGQNRMNEIIIHNPKGVSSCSPFY